MWNIIIINKSIITINYKLKGLLFLAGVIFKPIDLQCMSAFGVICLIVLPSVGLRLSVGVSFFRTNFCKYIIQMVKRLKHNTIIVVVV